MYLTLNLVEAVVITASILLLRYLWQSFQKWQQGHPRPFDPFAKPDDTRLHPEQRYTAYLKGRASMVQEYRLEDRCTDQEVLDYLRKYGHRYNAIDPEGETIL